MILIIVVARYFLKLLKNFFAGIMACYPFLPGSGSDIFKGFSVFVGAVITLGSTSSVNNIVSGIVLTYTGAFRLGDRVRVGNQSG